MHFILFDIISYCSIEPGIYYFIIPKVPLIILLFFHLSTFLSLLHITIFSSLFPLLPSLFPLFPYLLSPSFSIYLVFSFSFPPLFLPLISLPLLLHYISNRSSMNTIFIPSVFVLYLLPLSSFYLSTKFIFV